MKKIFISFCRGGDNIIEQVIKTNLKSDFIHVEIITVEQDTENGLRNDRVYDYAENNGKDGKKKWFLEDRLKLTKSYVDNINEIFELDKKNFELYSFIKWTDGIEAACSEGQISTDAHSLVLIRANGADTKTMALDIAAKADPRKWICVGAEVGKVLYTDKYVLMVMTYKDAYEGIKSNFEKLVGSDVQIVDMKKSGSLE